jgi:hypothetical protein
LAADEGDDVEEDHRPFALAVVTSIRPNARPPSATSD